MLIDVPHSAQRSALSIWLQATRAKSLAISSISVMAGGALAVYSGNFRWLPLLLAWIGAVAVQAGTNLTNVYYNYKGASADHHPEPQASAAVLQLGLLTPAQIRRASLACFGASVAAGAALTWMCGWTILLIGVPGACAGYFYAAPPLKLAYKAMGVITVFIFMGPVMVMGTFFAMTLTTSLAAFTISIPVGMLAAGIMHINDLRDYEGDLQHRKRTLTTLLGRQGSRVLLASMDAIAYSAVVGPVVAGVLPWPTLLVLGSLPHALSQLRLVFRETDPKLVHRAWGRSIQLHMEFGGLLIAGLLISKLFRY